MKRTKEQKTIAVEMMDKGTLRVFDVEIVVEKVFDDDYGADADGNRGIGRWFVEDVEVIYVSEVFEDCTEEILCDIIEGYGFAELPVGIQDAINNEIDATLIYG